jgi:FkbM family methyltransferase
MSIQDIVQESKEKVLEFLKKRLELSNSNTPINLSTSKVFEKTRKSSFTRRVNKLLEKFNLHIMHWSDTQVLIRTARERGHPMIKLASVELYHEIEKDINQLEMSYELMSDDYSRRIFEWYVKYRTAYAFIGGAANELYPPPFCGGISYEEFRKNAKITKEGVYIDSFVVKSGLPEIFGSFIVKQYEYFDKVRAAEGDAVVDVGALAGETALYFSKLVGKSGKVYAFEPVQDSYNLLVENLKRNHVKNIEAVKLGLFSENKDALISNCAGGSSLVTEGKGEKIRLVKLDDFIEERNLKKVDFIKMDIEGSELDALKSAERTMKKYKPKLAICVYHKGRDMIDIPQYLKSLVPEYKFFLKHNTEFWMDTVLYCTVEKSK